MTPRITDFIDPDTYFCDIDDELLERTTDEDPFTSASFDLLKEIGQATAIGASIQLTDETGSPRSWSRDEAILGGMMVRIYKLLVGLVEQASQHRGELVNQFLRSLMETSINLEYLIEFGSPELFQRYVAYSFRNDLKLREAIESRPKDEREAVDWRILESIDRALEAAEITVEEIPSDSRGDWAGSIWSRFEKLGKSYAYSGIFGGPSHYVHGNWHELYFHHLQRVEDGFVLETRWTLPRPQTLIAVGWMAGEATDRYVAHVGGELDDTETIRFLISASLERFYMLQERHEEFLSRMAGSE